MIPETLFTKYNGIKTLHIKSRPKSNLLKTLHNLTGGGGVPTGIRGELARWGGPATPDKFPRRRPSSYPSLVRPAASLQTRSRERDGLSCHAPPARGRAGRA